MSFSESQTNVCYQESARLPFALFQAVTFNINSVNNKLHLLVIAFPQFRTTWTTVLQADLTTNRSSLAKTKKTPSFFSTEHVPTH